MKKVFETCAIGTLQLKNRILRSATHEGMANEDGTPTDDLYKTYKKIAAGGAGAIITGYVGVKQNGKTFANMRMFDSDKYVDSYSAINAGLKEHKTPIILQVAHGGSRSNSKITGQEVVGPSFKKKNEYGDICREASETEIEEIINAFVGAISNAKKAGFDGVQIHAAHGYLLSEFISPVLNKRSDKWGGTTENRLRIVREILLKAREAVNNYPLLIKISAHDEFKNGLKLDEAIKIAEILQNSYCDAIEVSCGYGDFFYTVRMPQIPVDAIIKFVPLYRELSPFKKYLLKIIAPFVMKNYKPIHNYNVDGAELIRRNVDIPVIVVGGIRSLSDITEIITEKNIDFISMSRPFIIEPNIVEKFQKGIQAESRCINCGYCLFNVAGNKLRCYYGKIPKEKDKQAFA